MWNDKTVLLKSELGKSAIAQRLPVLPVRLRPVLILVDGKRSVGELTRLLESLGGASALQELVSLGMVDQPVPSAVSATELDQPVVEAVGDALPFTEYVRVLVAFFGRELGPNGQILVLQMGAAPDMRSLKPLIERGLDNLKYFKGPAAVAEFKATLGQQAPRA